MTDIENICPMCNARYAQSVLVGYDEHDGWECRKCEFAAIADHWNEIHALRRERDDARTLAVARKNTLDLVAKLLQGRDAEIKRLRKLIDELEDRMHKIAQWCEAYPLWVFPEPDLERARELLEAGGMTLGSVSASNMRHVLEGVQAIAEGRE